MESIEDYILRITTLANRNKELNEQLQGLVGRYELIQQQNEKYLNLLSEHSFEEIEARLRNPKQTLKKFKMASVMFANIHGFDELGNRPDAQSLIDILDELYRKFDIIAKKYDIIKIKTIGDSFLFAAGMREENRTNPIDIVRAALEMQQAVKNEILSGDSDPFWKVSIGIHTGPILGKPTGKKKLPYSISGESANIASRIGRASKVGDINISAMTFELVKEFFEFEALGEIPVKYNGSVGMYKAKSILSKFSTSENALETNKDFNIKYGLIQFLDIQEELLDILEKKLPKNLYYHNIKHTIDVITEVELIGWAEGLSEKDILLLKLAALFHDSGHTIDYKNHEEHSAKIARDILTNYRYPKENIDSVCRLIMSTKFPPTPKDKLEQVICDSDLDYLGRSDFIPVSNLLYKELKENEMIGSIEEWNNLQLNFIKNHQYHTKTARNLREVNKQIQIDRLKEMFNSEVNKAS